MRPFIVVSDGCNPDLFNELKNSEKLDVHPVSNLELSELKPLLPKINGIIIRSATTLDEAMLKLAPKLEIIIRAGEGTDNIDKEYCKNHNIKVENTPGANSHSAAEHSVALILSLLRKIPWANHSMTQGNWDKDQFLGHELTNKKIGIIGFGRVGQAVALMLRGFNPKILFFSDAYQLNEDMPFASEASLDNIFQNCDVITIHVPKTPETINLIDKKLLSKMKKDAVLINCARGGIVNEDDLYESLKANKILGAALDVFVDEPLPKDSKLRTLSNLILTPHLGASTFEAQRRISEMALHQIKEFFLNNILLNEVN